MHIQNVESLRDLPDLWLVPTFVVHDPLSPSTAEDGNPNDSRRRKERGQLQQLHREALRLGARCIVEPGVGGAMATVQAMVEGAGRTRKDVEGIVQNLQGAVLHWAQHRRRLLPSTVLLEGPPPELTSTEQEVLNLLCRGMTDAQMAHSLGLTTAAVGHAARAVMEKLGCDLRGEVIRVALDNDLVTE
jgi:DNA-binding NarL/FixJ family response regulator